MADRHGQRPTSSWDSGDLPSPFAVGDVVDVPEGAKALERMHGAGPGRYVISTAFSIDEGDAWYFRVSRSLRSWKKYTSDRLHVIAAGACGDRLGVDYLDGCSLVSTSDPEGLALREQMLADGWKPPEVETCPTCGQVKPPPPRAMRRSSGG